LRQKNEDSIDGFKSLNDFAIKEYELFRKLFGQKYPEQFLPYNNTANLQSVNKIDFEKELDIHFEIGHKISFYYKQRMEGDNLEKAIQACEEQIKFAPRAKKAFKSLYKGENIPCHQGFWQLAIIKEKQLKFDEALSLCKIAHKQGWADQWENKIEKLESKIRKAKK